MSANILIISKLHDFLWRKNLKPLCENIEKHVL
jgi:hypothetical protein